MEASTAEEAPASAVSDDKPAVLGSDTTDSGGTTATVPDDQLETTDRPAPADDPALALDDNGLPPPADPQ